MGQQTTTPPPETGAATKRKGGRPRGTTRGGENARKYGIRLPGPEAERLEAAAQAEGIPPGAWISRAVRRALEALDAE